MKGFSGADVKFTALHLDGQMDEGWHEHTWTVTCWVQYPPWRDMRALREAMLRVVDFVAPEVEGVRRIAPERWTNEAVGEVFLTLANVKHVSIDRDGFHARLER